MSAFDKIIGYELIKEELKQIADCLYIPPREHHLHGVLAPP